MMSCRSFGKLIVRRRSGSDAVARHSQGISPKHCTPFRAFDNRPVSCCVAKRCLAPNGDERCLSRTILAPQPSSIRLERTACDRVHRPTGSPSQSSATSDCGNARHCWNSTIECLRTLALPNRRPSTKPESRSGRDEQEAQLGWVLIQRCPKRVISGHDRMSDQCPLYPQ